MTTESPQTKLVRLIHESKKDKSNKVSIPEALEFRRNQYGLTKIEFAAVIGLDPSRYNEILHGRLKLTLRATKRAYAIGIPADVLLQPDPTQDE